MNQSDADQLRIQLALFAIALQASTTGGTYDQLQQSETCLPEVFGGNEKGRQSMSEEQLEMLIDARSASAIRTAEQQIKGLQKRCADLEAEMARVKATCVVATQS